MQRCWVNGERVVIWAFNPTREALAVIVNARGTLEEPGPWVQTGSCPGVLKLMDYYLICRALPKDIALVPNTERVALSSPRRSEPGSLAWHLEHINQMSSTEARQYCSLLREVLEQHGYQVAESAAEFGEPIVSVEPDDLELRSVAVH
jgi:hypothetical protein